MSVVLAGIFVAAISGFIWGFLAVVVVIVSLLLITIILIQDSKDGGLTSAFGGGGTSSALMGARMQKDLAKITTYLAIIFAVCVLAMGWISNNELTKTIGGDSQAEATVIPGDSGEAPAGGTGSAPDASDTTETGGTTGGDAPTTGTLLPPGSTNGAADDTGPSGDADSGTNTDPASETPAPSGGGSN